MTAPETLRATADMLENYVISDVQQDIIELMCLHIQRLDGSPRAKREAQLLMRMLDRS